MIDQVCNKCKKSYPATFEFFPRRERGKHGLRCTCHPCYNQVRAIATKKRKESNPGKHMYKCFLNGIKKHYGIDEVLFRDMMDIQEGCCKICGESLVNPEWSRLDCAVDHDHETGEVRGLLCGRCNSVLGYSRDSIKILESAILYLKAFI